MSFQPYFRAIAICLISMTCIFGSQAQNVKELERQRKQALQKLEVTNKMLNETKKSQRSSLNKLNIIGKSITERKQLIQNINTEISQLDNQIEQLNQEKQQLENKLGSLKADYVQLIRQARNKRSMYDKLAFVLSAKSFDQSLRRLRYLKEYSDYQKSQAIKIEKVKTEITQKNDTLKQNKSSKVEVVTVKQSEAQKLSKDQQKEKGLLTDLQKKENKLRSDLKIQQKKASDLNNRIEAAIAAEIRKAEARRAAAEKKRLAEENERRIAENERRAAENRSKGNKKTENESKSEHKETKVIKEEPQPSQSISLLTKEESIISGGFEHNKGRLPWPTSNGFIRGHFGIQKHPVLQFVTINNKGVYIQTPAGSSARAVFEGEVTSIIVGSPNAVIVKHGNYRTVYGNLIQVYVHKGQKVSAKQSIGKIYTDSDNDNKTELYFQIYNGRSLQNPESWLSR